MKRRLALLLALSLALTSFPVAGAAAAEATDPTAIEQVAVTEEKDIEEEASTATVNEDSTEDASAEEAAVVAETTETAATDEEAEVTETTEAATTEETALVEEPAETEEEESTEDADSAAAATTTEAAAVEEPEEVITATVETEAVVKKEAAAAKTTGKTGWDSNYTAYYKNGKKVTGLQVLKDKNGTMRTFFFDSKGVKKTGWVTIDNKKTVCYFADDRWPSLPAGAMLTGFRKIGNYWFYMADGTYAKKHNVPRGKQMTGWQYIDGKTYYFKEGSGSYPTGAAYTGWKTVNGKLYFFANSSYTKLHEGAMLTGWKHVNGKDFFFADSRYPSQARGTLVKGLVKISGNYFMFNKYGIHVKGWTTYNGRLAYYDSETGRAKKGWHDKGSARYYTMENGLVRYGWIKYNGRLYYLDPAQGGKMATGSVLMASGKLMFFDAQGRNSNTTGWQTVGNYSYYAYSNGTCARNTTIQGVKLDSMGRSEMSDMDRKAQGYSSNTNYLILVNKDDYKVAVYKGSKNSWVKQKEWYCTHGGSNTPTGVWTLDDHVTKRSAQYGWAVFDFSSAAFASHISAGNYFHSILYEKYIGLYYPNTNPYNEDPMDPSLKQDYSHGCIRLETENAEWIWDNVPLGSKVVIY